MRAKTLSWFYRYGLGLSSGIHLKPVIAGEYVRGSENPRTDYTPRMSLTDTAINRTKPREKPFKLADEKGLFLLVSPVKRNGVGRPGVEALAPQIPYRWQGKTAGAGVPSRDHAGAGSGVMPLASLSQRALIHPWSGRLISAASGRG
jgi:hypothetical protein